MAQAAREPVDRLLEPLVLECRDPTAALADDVVMVVAPRDNRLEFHRTFAGVHARDEADSVEQVEGAIDAGYPHSAAARA